MLHLTRKTDDTARRIERDKLTDRVLTIYQTRFRELREQNKELPNKFIDAMIRAELPGILKADAATVKTILEEEAPRLAAALDTPIEKKLAALFVMGRYETVIEEGEKKIAQPAIASLQTMGDAARALFDKTPDKKHLETALRYYTGAAALVNKDKSPTEWADIQIWITRMLTELSRLGEAEPLLREVIAIRKRELGENSLKYSAPLSNLALVLNSTNRAAEAETILRDVLASDEIHFGGEHPVVARNLNNLGVLLLEARRITDAEPMLRRALVIDEASFGDSHPNVARDINNLASLLKASRRFEEAEPLMRRALAMDEEYFGNKHPRVAIQLNNLAGLLRATKRSAEAEPLLRKALEIDEVSFGENDLKVAHRLNNLGSLLYESKHLAEAESLLLKAVTILEKHYGNEHPHVNITRKNLDRLRKEMEK